MPGTFFRASSWSQTDQWGETQELAEQAEVVFLEPADVGDFVLAHGEAFDAEAEGHALNMGNDTASRDPTHVWTKGSGRFVRGLPSTARLGNAGDVWYARRGEHSLCVFSQSLTREIS